MIGGSWRTRTASLLEQGVLAITPNSLKEERCTIFTDDTPKSHKHKIKHDKTVGLIFFT